MPIRCASGCFLRALAISVCVLLAAPSAVGQKDIPALRPPAVPLVAHDPYFSLWSDGDHLTDVPTRHWSGVNQELYGIVRVDGQNYRFLGAQARGKSPEPAMEQVALHLTPTRTIAVMQSPQIELEVEFFSPLFPDNLEVMARPVTYLTWRIHSRDGKKHDVTLYMDAAGTLATNDPGQLVNWSRGRLKGMDLLRIGTQSQDVLAHWGDNVRIDWGWFYLAVPQQAGAETLAGNHDDREKFLETGQLPEEDDIEGARAPQNHHPQPPLLSVSLPLGPVGEAPVTRHILLAYNDLYSVDYMQRKLLPYWRKQFPTFAGMLEASEAEYPALEEKAKHFDEALEKDMERVGGPEYANIAVLAYQEAIAAHKLVEDEDGHPFFMPKENFSNGSISTVDVIYPSAPMFLLLNPQLVEAQLDPVLRYAEMPAWKFPFAPHDLGVYPLANGQQYGGGEVSEENQMPVEESGDVILLVAAIARAENNAHYAEHYWPLLTKWAQYLLDKGLDPENQLCTDDFAGHLAHNANLSIKAIEALGAYAQLAHDLHHEDEAQRYRSTAERMARQWMTMADDGDHYRLAFDKPGTWSQKYNLVWDGVLGLHLFTQKVVDTEWGYYRSHMNQYGLPLDNRATYTKLDWELWTASMATRQSDFQQIVSAAYRFVNATPERVPLTDWYDTLTARQLHFQARSVVGGVYMKALTDGALWHKWAAASKQDTQPKPQ